MRRLALVGALVLAAGCSSGLSPAQQLQNDTSTVLDKANAKDVDGVHNAAAVMKSDIRSLNARNLLGTSKAQELLKTLNAIEAAAELLTAKPSAPPTPTDIPTGSQTDSPTPPPTASPTPSPTASPTPSPTASPTPSPTATATASPTRSAAAAVVPTLGKKKKRHH